MERKRLFAAARMTRRLMLAWQISNQGRCAWLGGDGMGIARQLASRWSGRQVSGGGGEAYRIALRGERAASGNNKHRIAWRMAL